jgi:uncharacterized protein
VSQTWLVARNETRGTVIAERVEDGDSFGARFMGLMGRRSLPAGTGLWLLGNGIHMLFMRFPIDAVFLTKPLSKGGPRRVQYVRKSLPTWRGVVWMVRHANGVLELPVGTIEASGTKVGDEVTLRPA